MAYDENKYGAIERHWFGLTKKCGGDSAGGFTFATTDATTIDQVTRFYPKGPIKLLKFGALTLATIADGGTGMDQVPARLLVNGSTETSADLDITGAAQYGIASVVSFTNAVVDAGSYIGIRTGTPETADGTAANTATTTGTVAFFIDYVRNYHESKWDA